MALEIRIEIEDPRLLIGIVEAGGVSVAEAGPELRAACGSAFERFGTGGYELPEERRSKVRQLLKAGGFSPTGRNRPAHELLLNDLRARAQDPDQQRRGFNHINNVVDVNNLVSLELQLPISIFDADKLEGSLRLRYGRAGESYAFNASGHELSLAGCIVCARGPQDEACGSPIKDSMACKIFPEARSVLGVVYASSELYSHGELAVALEHFAVLLCEHCSATHSAYYILPE